jgi:hypothetical protein
MTTSMPGPSVSCSMRPRTSAVWPESGSDRDPAAGVDEPRAGGPDGGPDRVDDCSSARRSGGT